MSRFTQIRPEEFKESPFNLIGKDWMLITAKKDEKINTMTASWGGFGTMWDKDVAYIAIRENRYTKEFVDNAETFSLTFFDDKYKDKLEYMGTTSGKEENKIVNCNFSPIYEDSTPYFEESRYAIICKKIYSQAFTPECFIDKTLIEKWYPQKDYHTLYIAEVIKILSAE